MTVCFIGHRTVDNAKQLKTKLLDTLSMLIAKGADTFIFGSRRQLLYKDKTRSLTDSG